MADPFASHQPALAFYASLAAANGKGIAELGCGDYSTPVLYGIAAAHNRLLASYYAPDDRHTHEPEDGPKWAKRFEGLVGPNYVQFYVESWSELTMKANGYGFILVDHEQFVRNRFQVLPRIVPRDGVVLFHDSDRIKPKQWEEMRGVYAFGGFFKDPPGTAVLSNTPIAPHPLLEDTWKP